MMKKWPNYEIEIISQTEDTITFKKPPFERGDLVQHTSGKFGIVGVIEYDYGIVTYKKLGPWSSKTADAWRTEYEDIKLIKSHRAPDYDKTWKTIANIEYVKEGKPPHWTV